MGDPEKGMENARELLDAMHDEKCREYCESCKNAIWDYNEASNWVDDCKKGWVAEWDDDEECVICEEHEDVEDDIY